MAILMLLELDGVTVEQYQQVNEAMGIRGEADAPEGVISHVAALTDGGLVIADVWDSEESLQRFFEERVGPAFAAAGVQPGDPQIHQVHRSIEQGAGTTPGFLMIIESDDFTPELYDQLTGRMDSHIGDGSAHPAVSHIAAVRDDGGMVFVDVWGSPEEFASFAEGTIGPAAEGMDMPALEPKFHAVHRTMSATAPV